MESVKDFKEKFAKRFLLVFSSLLVFVALTILFISPITKYLIEKFDEQYTGREITMDRAYVNPFTGYIHFNNLKIFENKSDSIFFSAKKLSVNISLHKLFSKTYEISELELKSPKGIIIQNKKDFNYLDLIEKFTPEKKILDTLKTPVHFNIMSVKISHGEFHYQETVIPINYFIKDVNFESSGMQWDADTIAAKFSFLSGIGSGNVQGNFTLDYKLGDYRLAVLIDKFDLNIIEQYLKDLTNYGSFAAQLDADINTIGNFNDKGSVTTHGVIAINDFHFGKSEDDDYASFDNLVVAIKEVSPNNHRYLYDSISLTKPYFKYERYEYLDNIQRMFGEKGEMVAVANANPAKFNLVIEIADYLKILSKNFFKSDYKIQRLAIYDGELRFNDFTNGEEFSMGLSPFTVIADSINRDQTRVGLTLNSGIKPFGSLAASLSVNPKDSSDFNLHYNFQKLPIAMFNPYTISFTSYPLDRGTIEMNGQWDVANGIIKSKNHLLVIDPRVAKRLKKESNDWIPMPLIMAFVRERGNVIDYEIPITGDLTNPRFNLRDIIFDILKNIFVKPVTTPYRMEVKKIETKIEKYLAVKWRVGSSTLLSSQENFIEKMANFLIENPTATINVFPELYSNKEKESILFFEAKKKYFLRLETKKNQEFTDKDSIEVFKMSLKDPAFRAYLSKQVKDSTLFTLQEKCIRLIGFKKLNTQFEKLNKDRVDNFITYFKKAGVEKQIKFKKAINTIPYNGFSFYRLEYKGEFPESLIKAYRQMSDLNEHAPRKEFKNIRKKYPTSN